MPQTSTSTGDDSGDFEVQRVVCTLAASSAASFTLVVRASILPPSLVLLYCWLCLSESITVFAYCPTYFIFICFLSLSLSSPPSLLQVGGFLTSGSITGDMTAAQVETVVEYLATVGNVTVTFPNSGAHSILFSSILTPTISLTLSLITHTLSYFPLSLPPSLPPSHQTRTPSPPPALPRTPADSCCSSTPSWATCRS
jgi:hypothetical protein